MKSIIHTVIAFTMLVSVSAKAGGDEEQIKSQISKYEKALNKSDVASVMELYGSDPIFMPQGSVAQSGREQVQKAYENVFKAIKLNIKFSVYEVEVFESTAWARTSSAGKTNINASGEMINEGNNELFIFKKEKGSWKIHRYLFSTNKSKK